jgi:hypothetical protein
VRTLVMSGLVVFCAVLGGAVLGGAAPATAAPAPATIIGATVTARPGPAITATATVITIDKISCASAKVCLAIGLEKLSATATAAWVTLVWDGNTWTPWAVPAPAKGARDVVLTGLSCVKGPSCVAVGEYLTAGTPGTTASFAVTWAGGALKLTPALAQPEEVTAVTVNAVSCVTARDCVAVGDVLTPDDADVLLFETWNGTKWTATTKALASGDFGQLNDISCETATRCVTVGYLSSIAGTRTVSGFAGLWTGSAVIGLAVPAPAGTSEPYLSAVSCASAATCVATGYDFADLGIDKGFAFTEMLDKSTWTLGKVAWQTGTTSSRLLSVSCVSVRYCIAAGTTGYARTASAATLVYDGTSWSALVPPPPPKGDNDDLSAVSCAAASSCVAIGNISPASGASSSLLSAFLTGARWTLLTVK